VPKEYIDLGTGRWHGRWISKQDLVEYLRCKYRVFVSFSTGSRIADMKESALLRLLLEKGLEFESEVVEDIDPKEVHSKEAIEPLAKRSLIIRSPGVLRNHELGIQGIPDLIDTGKGHLLPIEIKNHKGVTTTDELELAFYWLLLAPLRRKRVKPRGYVVLNTGEAVEVALTEDHFEEVKCNLAWIRELVKTGAQPSLSSECKYCQLSTDCRQEVVKSGGLSTIYNIGSAREKQLKDIGIDNISKLMRADEEAVNAKLLSRFGHTPGTNEIFRMKCHAFSIKSGKSFFFGDEQELLPVASSDALVIDLEYDPEGLIWLVGVAVRKGNRITYKQFFAERSSRDEERSLLASLIDLTKKNRSLQFITYSGTSADMPQLRKAWLRQSLPEGDLAHIEERHTDVYQLLQSSFRFPMKSMGLGDMEEYLGIQRQSPISDGLEALALYYRYVRTREGELKRQLLEYNREDLESTVALAGKMPLLMKESLTI